MKKHIKMRKGLLLMCYLLQINLIYGNNIQVTNVRLTGQNTTDDFTMVEIDISWENSWRYANGPTTGSLYYSNLSFGGGQSGLIPSFKNQCPY